MDNLSPETGTRAGLLKDRPKRPPLPPRSKKDRITLDDKPANTALRLLSFNVGLLVLAITGFILFMNLISTQSSPITNIWLLIVWIFAALVLLTVGIKAMITQLKPPAAFDLASIIEADETPSLVEDFARAIDQLARGYDLSRLQTVTGFTISSFFMVLGLGVMIVSITNVFGQDREMTILLLISGIIAKLISGRSFLLYWKNFQRLNSMTMRLQEAWMILSAYRIAQELPDDEKFDIVRVLVRELASSSETPTDLFANLPEETFSNQV